MFTAARLRLVAWNVSVLGVILALLGGAVYTMFSSQVYKGADQQLQTQLVTDLALIQRSGGDLTPAVTQGYVDDSIYRTLVLNAAGQVDVTSECPQPFMTPCPRDSTTLVSPQAVQRALATGRDIRTARFHDAPQRVLTVVINVAGIPRILQISRNAEGEANSLRELQILLIVGGLVGILLAGAGSLFLANRALVPIRQAFGRQRQFTADASHELRTPLALIRANAEMLYRHTGPLPPEDSELVGEIIQETDHLNRLVSDLLTLARADSDSIQIAHKPVDLRSLVAGVHDDVQRIAAANNVRSDLTLDGPLTVQGDEGRLRQLLLILLDNALKYTDAGGRVDVSLERADHSARLVVADTGIGIAPKDLPRVFDRFYRADRARQRETGGTGLGLSIARWIVQAHGGHIKVESQVGQGTRFLVDLPVGR